MRASIKKEFIEECIKNRKYLGFSYKDMANCLVDVSEKNYQDFEDGNYIMSDENMKRLIRVLCVKKPVSVHINEYIDTGDLTKEEVEDLSSVVEFIVGEDND